MGPQPDPDPHRCAHLLVLNYRAEGTDAAKEYAGTLVGILPRNICAWDSLASHASRLEVALDLG